VIQVAPRLGKNAPQADADLGEMLALPCAQRREAGMIDDRTVERRDDGVAAREAPRREDALALAAGVADVNVYRNMSLSCGRT
jgi:hypothetical protein